MGLGGAIGWVRVATLDCFGVWSAVGVHIGEIETNGPQSGSEDYRRLLGEKSLMPASKSSGGAV